jgi:hypothetical protein
MTSPTAEQRNAARLAKAHATGYPLEGRTTFRGMKISIEQQPGSVRSGTDEKGRPWETRMIYPYGYIRMTEGLDGDHLDCYIGPHEDATHAYVIDQVDLRTRELDEQKVMLGFRTPEDAKAAYLAHYDSPDFFGSMDAIPIEGFSKMVTLKQNWGTKVEHDETDSEHALLAKLKAVFHVEHDHENTSRGVIVALTVPRALGDTLTVEGGLPSSTFHVTLAYLGSLNDLDPDALWQLAHKLAALARMTPNGPALLGPVGTFPSGEDGTPYFLEVDAPWLAGFRERVMNLCDEAGTPGSRLYPNFHPHVTLAYLPEGDELPPVHATLPAACRFPGLDLYMGPNRVSFPFRRAMLAKAAQAQTAQDPVQRARAMYAQLTGDLTQADHTSGRIRAATEQLRTGHAHQAAQLQKPIRDMRGSALEDSYLDHAAESHTAARLLEQL